MPLSNNTLRLPTTAVIALCLSGSAVVTACGQNDTSSIGAGTTTTGQITATTSAPSADDIPTTSTLPASTLPATTALPEPSEEASAATSTTAPTPTSTTTTTSIVTSTTAVAAEPTLPQRPPTQSTTTTTVAESNCAIALEVVDGALGEARQVDIRIESEQRDDYLHVELNWADARVRLALYISPAGIGTTRVDAPGTAPISARVYATSSFQPSGVRCRT